MNIKPNKKYSFLKRIKVVLSLTLLVLIGIIAYLEFFTVSQETYYEEFNRLENILYSFEKDLLKVMDTVIQIGQDLSLTREEQIVTMNKLTQPVAELHAINPHLSIGFYAKDIEAIVSITPWDERKHTLGQQLDPDHPSVHLYLGGPVQKEIETVLRGHVARYARLIHWNGRPAGHIWANIPFRIYQKKIIKAILRSLPLILFTVGLGVFLLSFISKEIVMATDHIGEEVDKIASTNNQMTNQRPTLPIEFVPLYNKFIEMNNRLGKMIIELNRSTRFAAFGELAATVVHDIKNPLATIHATAQLGKISTSSPEKCTERFNSIIKSVDKLNEYLIDMLKRVKSDHSEKKIMTFKTILENTLNMWKPYFDKNSIIMDIEENEMLNQVIIKNSIPLQKAMLNLIKNAAEAMPEGGVISFKAITKKEVLEFTLSDTGEGISEENKPYIFTRFFSTKAQGTGIGLASTRANLEEIGGKIWFESTKGKGTTFFMQVPIEFEKRLSIEKEIS